MPSKCWRGVKTTLSMTLEELTILMMFLVQKLVDMCKVIFKVTIPPRKMSMMTFKSKTYNH